ncbi:efflux RND transporter periplasmic adaptor subunit [Polymorphobacter sp.]|uniref:efflux RND transporter periplasmic adaptor subunit n=1 Tax=Polymorphobacter sp. TaxID=1909290 RepID=UPI003F7064ED
MLALSLAGCGEDEAAAGRGGRPPAMVDAVSAEATSFAPRLVAQGSVAPLQTVAVRPRAEGEITAILFQEGDTVRAGQLLFRLDDRTAQAQLAQAQAQLATARANAAQARNELKRAEQLVDKGFVTGSVLDQRRAMAQSADASISSAEAAIQNARAQLSFLNIHAPVSGRTGELNFRRGANVRPADTLPLVTINQLSPISVRFLVPPQDIGQVRSAMISGKLPVDARAQGAAPGSPPLATGSLVFLDNNVDPGTGSIAAKAEFLNPDARLWPGALVTVVMPMGMPADRITLPESAVQVGRDTPYVWTIDAKGNVTMRDVTIAGRAEGRVYLATGISAGDRVVTDALSRLKPGDKVRVKGDGPGRAPPRTAARAAAVDAAG